MPSNFQPLDSIVPTFRDTSSSAVAVRLDNTRTTARMVLIIIYAGAALAAIIAAKAAPALPNNIKQEKSLSINTGPPGHK